MPSYDVVIHRAAHRELENIPESEKTSIKAIAQEASTYKQPSDHSDIKLMRDTNGMFRIRSGKYRALCDLEPPNLRILKIKHRETVYDEVSEAKIRQGD